MTSQIFNQHIINPSNFVRCVYCRSIQLMLIWQKLTQRHLLIVHLPKRWDPLKYLFMYGRVKKIHYTELQTFKDKCEKT